jgi:hypothetical protein
MAGLSRASIETISPAKPVCTFIRHASIEAPTEIYPN